MRELNVGLFTSWLPFEQPRVNLNLNLARTRSGKLYRNRDHACMFGVPDVPTVEAYLDAKVVEAAWSPVAPSAAD